MTPETKDLMRFAAKVGHRRPAGHHCHSIIGLASTEAEHERHADRIKRGLIVQRDGLARALSSHDRRTSQPITGGAS